MGEKVEIKFSSVPQGLIEPLGNYIRKALYILKERYAVIGLSMTYTDKYSGSIKRLLPYDIIPNSTVSPSELGILLTSKRYTLQPDVLKSLQKEEEEANFMNSVSEIRRITTTLSNTKVITMKSQ